MLTSSACKTWNLRSQKSHLAIPDLPKTEATLKLQFDGFTGTFVSESIAEPTNWTIQESDGHTVVVHLGGEMTELVTELDGRHGSIGPATAGEIWTVPAGHAYASSARGGEVRYAVFKFPVDSQGGAQHDIAPLAGHRDDQLHRAVCRLICHAWANEDTAQIEVELAARDLQLRFEETYCYAPRPLVSTRPEVLGSSQARCVRDFIGDHLSDKITLDDLAFTAGMQKNRFIASFRHTFGITPAQYLIQQRLRRAQWLLLYTPEDITTIALESGFSSHSHLTSRFKQQFGYSPSVFRENTPR